MSPGEIHADYLDRGIAISVVGDSIEILAEPGALSDADIECVKSNKADLVKWLRLLEGLPIDDDAAFALRCSEVDPDCVPICKTCARYCDTESLCGRWLCSRCDKQCEERRKLTSRILRERDLVRRKIDLQHE